MIPWRNETVFFVTDEDQALTNLPHGTLVKWQEIKKINGNVVLIVRHTDRPVESEHQVMEEFKPERSYFAPELGLDEEEAPFYRFVTSHASVGAWNFSLHEGRPYQEVADATSA